MISDIETILAAFAGNWKPGIEEQSIRMAHAVAMQGDTATASNILRFIAIPEPMKLQILGASLQKDPPATAQNPITQSTSLTQTSTLDVEQKAPPKQMPDPLLPEVNVSADTMAIPVVSEADIVPPAEASLPVSTPAFANELTNTPVDIGVTDVAVQNTNNSVASEPVPTEPVGALPFQRQKLFDQAFASVQSQTAVETSKPMVKDADNIPVIHTYEVPAPSERAQQQQDQEKASKGAKLFQSLEALLQKVVTTRNVELQQSCIGQWERLNTEFPDFKELNGAQWGNMFRLVEAVRILEHAKPVGAEVVSTEPDPNTPTSTRVMEPVKIASKETPEKSVQDVVKAEQPQVEQQKSEAGTSLAGGGYFAQKASQKAKEQNPKQIETEDAQEQDHTDEEYDIASLQLPNGVTVMRNMTITGDNIYRVVRIEKKADKTAIVFTNEIQEYVVTPEQLSGALDNPDTQADEFFAHYVQSGHGGENNI